MLEWVLATTPILLCVCDNALPVHSLACYLRRCFLFVPPPESVKGNGLFVLCNPRR